MVDHSYRSSDPPPCTCRRSSPADLEEVYDECVTIELSLNRLREKIPRSAVHNWLTAVEKIEETKNFIQRMLQCVRNLDADEKTISMRAKANMETKEKAAQTDQQAATDEVDEADDGGLLNCRHH